MKDNRLDYDVLVEYNKAVHYEQNEQNDHSEQEVP